MDDTTWILICDPLGSSNAPINIQKQQQQQQKTPPNDESSNHGHVSHEKTRK
jgi:hypothetical protein